MTPIATDTDKLREFDDEVRRAWSDYYDTVQELTGEEYDRVEAESWEALQSELGRIERRRRLSSVASA